MTTRSQRHTPTIDKRRNPQVHHVHPFSQWWPYVTNATHLIVSGDKGSGKTTLVRAVMLSLKQEHPDVRYVLIDPHYKRGEYGPGITPIAAGRRFEEARAAFAWGNQELDRRYKERADIGTEDFPLVVFVVDEFDLFTDQRPDVSKDLRELASRFLSMIGDESRKVGIRLIVIAHGTELDNLALKGRGSKRNNYMIVQMRQGPNQLPEPTGTLRSGSDVWTIDTTEIPAHAAGTLTPDILVTLPAVAHAEDTSTDPIVLQRRIAELEHQLQHAAAAPRVEIVNVPVLTDEQLARLEATLGPVLPMLQEIREALDNHVHGKDHLVRRAGAVADDMTKQVQQAAAGSRETDHSTVAGTSRSGKRAPKQTSRTVTAKRRVAGAAPSDAISQTLAIPAIAAKISQAQSIVNARAAGHIPSILRLLWSKALRPEEIAEGRGNTSTMTKTRLRAACRALCAVKLLVDTGDGKLTVNHAEIERLIQLAHALQE